jgi:hypothetical protein
MNKNKIKNYLAKRFLEEGTPGIDVTRAVLTKSKAFNDEGLKDIEKNLSSAQKSEKKSASQTKDMPQNKFNYNSDNEVTYHQQMEDMNGTEMNEYDRDPNKQFKDRAIEAIEGSSNMGNNPEWANVVPKQQGFTGPEFGKNLVKAIKASTKKREDAVKGVISFGDDIETVSNNYAPMAKHSAINENADTYYVETWYDNGTKQYLGSDGTLVISDGRLNGGFDRQAKVLQSLRKIKPFLFDGPIELRLVDSKGNLIKKAKMTLKSKMDADPSGDNLEDLDRKVAGVKYNENIHNTAQMGGVTTSKGTAGYINDTSKMDKDYADSIKKTNNDNNDKTKIKESMKRLKFKQEFKGVGNALKLIPESYRTDKKVFEMTDGNESYTIRWDGTLAEGKAVVLMASDKTMVNEDIKNIKHLMGYKSQDTLGLVKGQSRVDENKVFGDIWKKSRILIEGEDIDGQKAPEKKTDDKVAQASDAKKHVEGSVSTDKGTKAPKAPEKKSDDKVKPQAPEAKKNVHMGKGGSNAKIGMGLGDQSEGEGEWDQMSIPQAAAHGNPSSTTYAPAPKTGEWDKISVPQSSDAKKHVHMNEGIQLGENYFAPITEEELTEMFGEEEIDETEKVEEIMETEEVEETMGEEETIDETEDEDEEIVEGEDEDEETIDEGEDNSSFAKLAPPYNKATYADKIAGATKNK